MAKVEKSSKPTFAKGGKTKMFGQQGANPQRPGVSAHAAADGKGASFAKGGSTKMFGFRGSSPAEPGKSTPC